MQYSASDLLGSGLKLRHLVFVTAVADESSIVGAARVLHVTQPVVTRTIRDVEEILGVPLFERLPRGTVATIYGESFISHARAVLAQLRHATRDLELLSRAELGTVAVGTHLAGSAILLPRAIATLKSLHPTLTVKVVEGTQDILRRSLLTGTLDVILGRLTATAPEGTVQDRLYSEPVRFVAREGHPLHRRKHTTLPEMVDYPWVLPGEETTLRAELEQLFVGAEVTMPRNVVECTSPLTLQELLLTTDAVGVIPELVAERSPGIKALPAEPTSVRQAVGMTMSALRPLSPGAQALAAQLRATAALLER
ncbi:LysR substrate-binding domain-containing protein [Amycolatopsis jejuensis]|uniref:LysR substrate-binding domain-containing protein n=1 Tax=Amycolatopsis jejuensis TaxID=330084 RepID=UPI0005277AFE|nr:LysR substrate-binding domain-containing protein [Amycolatopsis jejuensis]